MIRKTLPVVQAATFSIDLPDDALNGMPRPTGTGFFVSESGWFVTAAHVVTVNNKPDGLPRQDMAGAHLAKEFRFGHTGFTIPNPDPGGAPIPVPYGPPIGCEGVSIELIEPELDFALLHVDFAANKKRHWLQGREGYPYVKVSRRQLSEGEPVYAFGYPLGEADLTRGDQLMVGHAAHKPRVTSAIVASTLETSGPIMTSADPQTYVLDKALNYGNSGGPIIASDTGHVHAFCSRFQPLEIRQPQLGPDVSIRIPSLYGIVVSLANSTIENALKNRGVDLTNE